MICYIPTIKSPKHIAVYVAKKIMMAICLLFSYPYDTSVSVNNKKL